MIPINNYIDIDITMERVNDEIDTIDDLIGGHIERGVHVNDLLPLARLRANLSRQRVDLQEAMDKAESITEVHMDVDSIEFDVESYMDGSESFISVETIR